MTTSARPLVRLTSPGDIAAAVPHLCGYVPTESLVVLSLRGGRARVGLTMRFDLPVEEGDPELADLAAVRLAADGARRAVAVHGRARGGRGVTPSTSPTDGRPKPAPGRRTARLGG